MKTLTKINAIQSLVPDAQVTVRGDVVEWHVPNVAPVTDEQINEELNRLILVQHYNEYQRKRAAEYPPMSEYLDAIVKNDPDQLQDYLDKCLAVKAKYPKPTPPESNP